MSLVRVDGWMVVLCARSDRRVFGVPAERACLEEEVLFSCARLGEGEESSSGGKILLFSRVGCFIINSERTSPSHSATDYCCRRQREGEEEGLVATRVSHRVELYGPLALGALVATLSSSVPITI